MADSAGEIGFIRWLRQQIAEKPGVVLGPGDDAAAWIGPAAGPLLITTDMLLEGTSFRLAEAGAQRVGRKALAVNISDIAAMAGIPRAAVISVGLPRSASQSLAKEMFLGMQPLAQEFDIAIIGGDTNVWAGELVISVTLLGEATAKGPIPRSGAQPGDWIFVTGPLGGSIQGHQFDFTPRVREAIELVHLVNCHAMIDISDGLARDLHHICNESRCGAVIDADRVPISTIAQNLEDGKSALEHALGDGEDFELLFTVGPEDGRRLANGAASIALFHVGECLDQGVWIDAGGIRRPLPALGYEHVFDR